MTIEELREHNLDRAVAHWMSHVKRDAEWSDADPDSASIAHDGFVDQQRRAPIRFRSAARRHGSFASDPHGTNNRGAPVPSV